MSDPIFFFNELYYKRLMGVFHVANSHWLSSAMFQSETGTHNLPCVPIRTCHIYL
jgi:hypothetical protein